MVSKRCFSSRIRMYVLAASAGAAVGLVDYLLGLWMSARGLRADVTLVDEFLLAIFTGALVLVIEFAHQRDQKRINDRLRIIESMNHHVRNALQTIIDTAYVHGHLDEIRSSVDRIGWALREILPGQELESDEDSERVAEKPAHVQVRGK